MSDKKRMIKATYFAQHDNYNIPDHSVLWGEDQVIISYRDLQTILSGEQCFVLCDYERTFEVVIVPRGQEIQSITYKEKK